ncbi:unnamed protein product [Caenorhabditis sp. 36 PRJEB53466]|nr:unnamed protein product [Caenorhabditis sp. 36 PRJEB53466]
MFQLCFSLSKTPVLKNEKSDKWSEGRTAKMKRLAKDTSFGPTNGLKEPKPEPEDDLDSFNFANGHAANSYEPKEEPADETAIGNGYQQKFENLIDRVPKEDSEAGANPSSGSENSVINTRDERFGRVLESGIKEELKSETIESRLDKVVKAEVPDEGLASASKPFELPRNSKIHENSSGEKKPKDEPVDVPPPVPVPMWRPNVRSLADLVDNEDVSDNDDIGLGNSILFDRYRKIKKKPSRGPLVRSVARNSSTDEENDFYENNISDDEGDNDDDEPQAQGQKKPMSHYKYRAYFNQEYVKNVHPSIQDMLKMAEHCGVRYRTVWESYVEKRARQRVKCQKDDHCTKISLFFLREKENMAYAKIDDAVRSVLEDEIETHLLSRKRFSLGYVHLIMEKTDLAPSFIRGQYEGWKKKLLTKDRDDYRIKDWKRENETTNNMFSIETLRRLEEAYLKKKYQSTYKDWVPKEVKELADQLGLEEKHVSNWMEKRSGAVLGLQHDIIEYRRAKTASKNAAKGRKLPIHKTNVLIAEFEKNDRPGQEIRIELAKRLNLSEQQVRNYFNKRRIKLRRDEEWAEARKVITKIPRKKFEILDKIAAEKKKSPTEYMVIAEKLELSYDTLCNYIDWRKSLTVPANKVPLKQPVKMEK